jgi:dTDP-glucose pyrophosphorylase
MDETGLRVLIVVDDENRLLGIITDGDLRRAIINGIDLKKHITLVMTKNPKTINVSNHKDEALELMKKYSLEHIPVIDKENKLVDLILWSDFLNDGKIIYPLKETPVVIMAGGKGTRLDPFTKILPKPLIPVGDKPIIEIIIRNFRKYGFNNFIISLNYRAEMIKLYFSENPIGHQIDFIEEKEFLGTAGSLSINKEKLTNTFIVSNSDVIVDVNFDTLLDYHKKSKNRATILGVIRHIKIPYGVLEMKNADLDEIVEKPEYHFIINSGIYVLEPEIVQLIPRNQPMDMPSLLKAAKEKGFKTQVYPISCSWFDVGEWKDYQNALEYIERYSK